MLRATHERFFNMPLGAWMRTEKNSVTDKKAAYNGSDAVGRIVSMF